MMQRASLYLTLCLRFLYLFFPFMMWVLGTLAMLVTTIVTLVALAWMDQVPARSVAWLDLADGRSAETVTRPGTRQNSVDAVAAAEAAAAGDEAHTSLGVQQASAPDAARHRRPLSHAGSSGGPSPDALLPV